MVLWHNLRQKVEFFRHSNFAKFFLVPQDEPHVRVGDLLGQEKFTRNNLTHKRKRKSDHMTEKGRLRKKHKRRTKEAATRKSTYRVGGRGR